MPDRHLAHHNASPSARQWLVGIGAALIALAALVIGSNNGKVSGNELDPHLTAWLSAGAVAVFGVLATTRLSTCLGRLISHRSVPSAGGAVRILTACVGYIIILFAVLAVLHVPIEKLLVGAGLAGIVLGIAATQSLGNVFAGFVIILTRPFAVGDHVRIRSGALGGVFDAWVVEMSLTYTSVRLDDGPWKIPNSAMLSAAIGQLPRTADVPPFPLMASGPVPGGVAPATAPAPAPAAGPASTSASGPGQEPATASSTSTDGMATGTASVR